MKHNSKIQSKTKELKMVDFFPTIIYGDALSWLLIIIGVIIATKIIVFILEKFVKKFTKKTKTTLDDKLLDLVEKSLMVIVVIVVAYYAAIDLVYFIGYSKTIKLVFSIITIFGGAYIVSKTLHLLLSWYGEEVAKKTESDIDDIFIPVMQKTIDVMIIIIAFMFVLSELGITITPILASLGVASLAIALALKDTLAEFFAGFYLMVDRPIKKGDFVKLESGDEGIVEDIGWRTSRIRTLPNTMIVVPNSKLASSIVQDYDEPRNCNGFAIKGGVSYESDLDKTEKILRKNAEDIIKESDEAIKDFKPIIRFTAFGDSNIDFIVIMKTKKYLQKHPMIHEFIKRTKREFDKAGIEINYPARKIYYAQESGEKIKSKKR